ncbi:MAG: glycosyltransferase family 39 protein [Ignavibacteriota bacterium]
MEKVASIFSKLLFDSKRSQFLWAMTISALVLRIAIVIIAGNPHKPEMYEHGAIAHNLHTGHGFAMHWPYESLDSSRVKLMRQPIRYETAYQPPLNPYLIYATYLLFDETPTAIILLMLFYSVVSATIPLLVFRTGILIDNENSARVSTLISVLFLPAAVGVITFSGSPLYQVLGLMTFYFALLSAHRPSLRSFFYLGLSCGTMILLRSEFLIIGFIFIILATYFAWKHSAINHNVAKGVLALIICVSIIAPWTYRNYALFHKFIPTVDRPWHEIWRGHNQYSTPTGFDAEGRAVWIHASRFPKIVAAMDSIPYDQQFTIRVDSIFKHEALAYIGSHPLQSFGLDGLKVLELCTVVLSPGIPANPLYYILMFGVTLSTLFGMNSLVRADRRNHRYSNSLLYCCFFLYYCFIIALTFILPRYQIYIYTSILPLSGVGIYHAFSFKLHGIDEIPE